jgi:hypothetical protein
MNRFCLPLALGAATLLAAAQTAPTTNKDEHLAERQDIIIEGLPDTGYILDIGGGCRGTIGRIKLKQVVAIGISPRELKDALNCPNCHFERDLRIRMDPASRPCA